MVANAASTVVVSAPALMIPHLHLDLGYSLVESGLFAMSPTIGTMLSLFVWGAFVDRFGERWAISAGLSVVTAAGIAATLVSHHLGLLAAAFFVAGIGAASPNTASGRLVVGWFAPRRRGLAMGIRQTALPLGLGIAALVVPTVIEERGLAPALALLTLLVGLALVGSWLGIVDPERVARERAPAAVLANPYRDSATLGRIHVVSALLVIPQFAVWTFMLVWLIDHRDWSITHAAAVVALGHGCAVVGRIGAGQWSDRVGSRLRPLRQVAMAAAVAMVAVALLDNTALAVPAMLVAAMIVVADNGLAFTSVAEISGPFWAGRALGIQNTGQYAVSALVPPSFGWIITHSSYPAAFAISAVFAVTAVILVPRDGHHFGLP